MFTPTTPYPLHPPSHPKAINCDDHRGYCPAPQIPPFRQVAPMGVSEGLTKCLRWETSEVGTISQHDANITIKENAEFWPFWLVLVSFGVCPAGMCSNQNGKQKGRSLHYLDEWTKLNGCFPLPTLQTLIYSWGIMMASLPFMKGYGIVNVKRKLSLSDSILGVKVWLITKFEFPTFIITFPLHQIVIGIGLMDAQDAIN